MKIDDLIVYLPDMDWVADPKSMEDEASEIQAQTEHSEGNRGTCKILHGPPPPGAHVRKWILRSDNHGHHHGIVKLSESPLYLFLSWHETVAHSPQRVGAFRLNLPELLLGGYIRTEPADSSGPNIRLRIVRADDGRFYVQTNDDGPRILLA